LLIVVVCIFVAIVFSCCCFAVDGVAVVKYDNFQALLLEQGLKDLFVNYLSTTLKRHICEKFSNLRNVAAVSIQDN
jgi:hypothetical protein